MSADEVSYASLSRAASPDLALSCLVLSCFALTFSMHRISRPTPSGTFSGALARVCPTAVQQSLEAFAARQAARDPNRGWRFVLL